ncbi:MAG: hypothetical protein ACTSQB_05260 [Candidatus Heimdallarchaeota archaeon]
MKDEIKIDKSNVIVGKNNRIEGYGNTIRADDVTIKGDGALIIIPKGVEVIVGTKQELYLELLKSIGQIEENESYPTLESKLGAIFNIVDSVLV